MSLPVWILLLSLLFFLLPVRIYVIASLDPVTFFAVLPSACPYLCHCQSGSCYFLCCSSFCLSVSMSLPVWILLLSLLFFLLPSVSMSLPVWILLLSLLFFLLPVRIYVIASLDPVTFFAVLPSACPYLCHCQSGSCYFLCCSSFCLSVSMSLPVWILLLSLLFFLLPVRIYVIASLDPVTFFAVLPSACPYLCHCQSGSCYFLCCSSFCLSVSMSLPVWILLLSLLFFLLPVHIYVIASLDPVTFFAVLPSACPYLCHCQSGSCYFLCCSSFCLSVSMSLPVWIMLLSLLFFLLPVRIYVIASLDPVTFFAVLPSACPYLCHCQSGSCYFLCCSSFCLSVSMSLPVWILLLSLLFFLLPVRTYVIASLDPVTFFAVLPSACPYLCHCQSGSCYFLCCSSFCLSVSMSLPVWIMLLSLLFFLLPVRIYVIASLDPVTFFAVLPSACPYLCHCQSGSCYFLCCSSFCLSVSMSLPVWILLLSLLFFLLPVHIYVIASLDHVTFFAVLPSACPYLCHCQSGSCYFLCCSSFCLSVYMSLPVWIMLLSLLFFLLPVRIYVIASLDPVTFFAVLPSTCPYLCHCQSGSCYFLCCSSFCLSVSMSLPVWILLLSLLFFLLPVRIYVIASLDPVTFFAVLPSACPYLCHCQSASCYFLCCSSFCLSISMSLPVWILLLSLLFFLLPVHIYVIASLHPVTFFAVLPSACPYLCRCQSGSCYFLCCSSFCLSVSMSLPVCILLLSLLFFLLPVRIYVIASLDNVTFFAVLPSACPYLCHCQSASCYFLCCSSFCLSISMSLSVWILLLSLNIFPT